MSYVLTFTRPPRPGAAFGPAKVYPGEQQKAQAAQRARGSLLRRGVDNEAASVLAVRLLDEPLGTEITDTRTGHIYRIDGAESAPHLCPCCRRMVLPTDHAYADADDAYCLGCFTWRRDVPQCLPANSAHTEEP